jgi:hypothetical protein
MRKTNGAFQCIKSGEFYSASQLLEAALEGILRDEDSFVWKTNRTRKGVPILDDEKGLLAEMNKIAGGN